MSPAAPVIAVHTDFVADVAETQASGGSAVLAAHHAAALRAGGIDCICEHVVGDTFETLCFPTTSLLAARSPRRAHGPSALKHALSLLGAFLRDVEQSRDDFMVATSATDIRQAAEAGKVAVVLCFQGVSPLEGEPHLLDVFHRLGLRIMGITTNSDNTAGRSQLGRPGGLTMIGRAIVARAAALRIVVDVAHLSDAGIRDVLQIVDGPIIASNSNTRHHHDIPRNLSDEMIRAIASSGGIVGVHANGDLITDRRPVTLDHLVDHIEHVATIGGIDHAAVGPDLVDDSMYPAARYRGMFAGEGHFSAPYPQGLDSHADLPRLRDTLRQRGFSAPDIARIMGGNALRVFESVWGS